MDQREAAAASMQAAATFLQGSQATLDDLGALATRIFNWVVSKETSPAPVSNLAQGQQNLTQGGVQTTVTRDLSNDERRWRDALIDNPNDWYNNVGDSQATSGGGKGPDFRFKNDENVKPLFLNGRYGPAPAWVFEHLGRPFPGEGGGQQAAPQAQSPAPQEVPF